MCQIARFLAGVAISCSVWSPSVANPVVVTAPGESRHVRVGGFDALPAPSGYTTDGTVHIKPMITSHGITSISALSSQAAYRDSLWEISQNPNDLLENIEFHFARRGSWLHTATISSLGHMIPGLGDSGTPGTRSSNSAVDDDAPRWFAGLLSQAIATKGTSDSKDMLVAGSLSRTFAAYTDPHAKEVRVVETVPFSTEFDRQHRISVTEGGEYYSYISDAMGYEDEATGLMATGMDARANNYQEDMLWDYTPAIIKKMVGKRSIADIGGHVNSTVEHAAAFRAG